MQNMEDQGKALAEESRDILREHPQLSGFEGFLGDILEDKNSGLFTELER